MADHGCVGRVPDVRLPFSREGTYNGPVVASGDVFLQPGVGITDAGPPNRSDSSCLSISPLQD